MTHYHEPDPTPPHGTPRPPLEVTVATPAEWRPLSSPVTTEEVLHALDAVEDSLIEAREWITQTLETIRNERYTPYEALTDSVALQFSGTSVFHSVRVALGAMANLCDESVTVHPFGGALDR